MSRMSSISFSWSSSTRSQYPHVSGRRPPSGVIRLRSALGATDRPSGSEPPHMDPGHALGERWARRDERALEDAYAVYGASLLAYLRRYVGPDEAEDVLQRTF